MSSATTFNGKYSNLLIFDTAFRYLLITKIQISSLCKTIHPAVSHMDSSISELQPSVCCKYIGIKSNNRMKNSVDQDELAYYKPSHLDLQCFQRYLYWSTGMKRVKG